MTGCASMGSLWSEGKETTDKQLANFTVGKTTKNEVVAALGDPQEYKFDRGNQILIYKYQKFSPLFQSKEEHDTTFIFNENLILKDILKSTGTKLREF